MSDAGSEQMMEPRCGQAVLRVECRYEWLRGGSERFTIVLGPAARCAHVKEQDGQP
jgi:hypothetical protein